MAATAAPIAVAASPLAPITPIVSRVTRTFRRAAAAGGGDTAYDNFFTRHPVVTFLLGGVIVVWLAKYFFHAAGHKSTAAKLAAVQTLAKIAQLNPLMQNNWGAGPGGVVTYYGGPGAAAEGGSDAAAGLAGVANMGIFTPMPITAIIGILQSTGALNGLASGLKKLFGKDKKPVTWSALGNVDPSSVEGLVLSTMGVPSCNGMQLWPPMYQSPDGKPSCNPNTTDEPKFRCDYTSKCVKVSE